MHIPVTYTITSCPITVRHRLREFLFPNRLIHVKDVHTGDSENSVVIVGVMFDYEDIELITMGLANFGTVHLRKGKVKALTKKAVLSGFVVAGIVIVALFAHSFNDEFYTEVFENHNSVVVRNTILILIGSAAAGFFLEMFIVYRERRLAHQ